MGVYQGEKGCDKKVEREQSWTKRQMYRYLGQLEGWGWGEEQQEENKLQRWAGQV